jgi:hypothetical protein
MEAGIAAVERGDYSEVGDQTLTPVSTVLRRVKSLEHKERDA